MTVIELKVRVACAYNDIENELCDDAFAEAIAKHIIENCEGEVHESDIAVEVPPEDIKEVFTTNPENKENE